MREEFIIAARPQRERKGDFYILESLAPIMHVYASKQTRKKKKKKKKKSLFCRISSQRYSPETMKTGKSTTAGTKFFPLRESRRSGFLHQSRQNRGTSRRLGCVYSKAAESLADTIMHYIISLLDSISSTCQSFCLCISPAEQGEPSFTTTS